jgi:hypothetical protein
MSDETFDRSLWVLQQCIDNGTQKEVNLNGNGESCLDPALPRRARAVKDIMGNKTVMMCTNGVNMTPRLAGMLKESGIDRIDISVHSILHARQCAEIFMDVGIKGIYSMGALQSPHNWAGQLPNEYCTKRLPVSQCDPIIEGRGYIQKEGNITPCCYDYRNLGMFGTVFDDDIMTREVRPYSLCETCHQQLPQTKEKAA